MATTVRCALIGAGRIGCLHAENLVRRIDEAELVGVADCRPDAARALAAALGIQHVVSDHQQLLADPNVDAVIICTPAGGHAQLVAEAAAAGKHVFCEKPIDFDIQRIDDALAAVDRADVKLQVGFNRRFDPDFTALRQAISDGRAGTPYVLRITSRDPAPPPIEYVRTSGGIFLDMAIHDFDMARYLIAEEVRTVFATGGVLVDPAIGEAGDLDTAVTVLQFASEAIATIDNSRQAAYGYDQRVELLGSAGMLVADNPRTAAMAISDTAGVHTAGPTASALARYTEAYLREMQAFVTCVAQDSSPPVTGGDGRMATLLGLAAAESHRRGKVISLAEFDA